MKRNDYAISGLKILHRDQWLQDYVLVIKEGKIHDLLPAAQFESDHNRVYKFPKTHYLTPGFIDLHVHGAGGHDVMDSTKLSLHQTSECLAREGVTGFLATTTSAEEKKIAEVMTNIAESGSAVPGAKVLGVHLEGPFLAHNKRGAHPEIDNRINLEKFNRWQTCADGQIKIVTVAPELQDSTSFIAHLTKHDVVAAIGHTNATFEQANSAIASGARHATHIFNAMRSMDHREPGIAIASLIANEVICELIADPYHLHPAMLKLAFQLKGKEKLVLISDAMRAKGMPDGVYELAQNSVNVKNGKATLASGMLAGSTLRLPDAIKRLQQAANCSFIDAIHTVTRTPASVLKLENRKGRIEIGYDADLVVLDKNLNVDMTICEGKVVFGD